MPDAISNFFKRIKDFWNKMDKKQKIMAGISVGVVLIAVILWATITALPRYTPLTDDNVPSGTLTQMRRILTDNNIMHKLTPSRTGIMVRERDFDEAEFQIMAAGIQSDTMNIDDVLSKIKINTTESDKNKIWSEYDTVRLQDMIKMIEDVADAKVIVTRPATTILVSRDIDLQNKPSASVSLTTKRELTGETVQSIVSIVAHSVLNLDRADVTIVDQFGKNLLNALAGQGSSLAEKQVEMTNQQNLVLENKIKSLYGYSDYYDFINASVMAVLDFTSETIVDKDIRLIPGIDAGALISSRTASEEASNAVVGAEPGMGTNPGNYENPGYQFGDANAGTYSSQENIRNWDYPTTLTEIENAPGALVADKTTASVVFVYGTNTKEPISEEWLADQRPIIANALSIPVENVSVTTVPRTPQVLPARPVNEILWEVIDTYGIYLLLLLLALALLLLTLPRKRRQPEQQLVPAVSGADGSESELEGEDYDELEQIDEDDLAEIETSERSEIRKQLDKFIEQKPEAAAQLLRNWLTDEWD